VAAPPARRSARRTSLLALVALLSTGLWLTAAGPTFACSCVAPEPLAAYSTTDYAIFSGTTGPSDARGVPVRVENWFSGPGPAPIVYLAASSFGDSASCGTNLPAAGTDWIWVAYLPEDGGDPGTGLCNPHAQLGTPEGDAMLADAISTFGGGPTTDPPAAATDPPGTTATDPPTTVREEPVAAVDSGVLIVVATVGLAVVVLLGAVLIARRRPGAGA
jgi:hypothetical protein